ncbi:hypothetical protein LCGC14_1242810 [marine sediment metagenome]|uniref:Uncharacterized protein n=1 Tax=marine sediment metagenome TaxID=412755 RepID=A0A0F9L982_9ZZZZ
MSLNIFPIVWATVRAYFSVAQRARLAQYLTQVNRKDDDTKIAVTKIFDFVDGSTTAAELLIVMDFIMEINFGQQPKIFFVNEGEDFCLQIDLEEGRDFTGYFLTLRDADGNLLSPDTIAGDSYANAPIQYITISDLSLAAGNFYRVNALLEHPAGGVASGNAASLLTKIILLVEYDIDI